MRLPSVLVRCVADFLVWAETYALRLTCRSCNAELRNGPKVADVLRAQFPTAEQANQVCRLLLLSGNQLTGSFVLRSLFGGARCPWNAGDIDVLTLQRDVARGGRGTELEQYYGQQLWASNPFLGYHLTAVDYLLDSQQKSREWKSHWCIREPFGLPMSFTHVGHETGRHYMDTLAPKRTQVQYNFKSLPDFVKREADFAFTRVLFDGERVRVADWGAVWTRSATVRARDYKRLPYYRPGSGEGDRIVERLVDRCAKYASRGFVVRTDLPSTESGRKALKTAILRHRDLELVTIGCDERVPRRWLSPEGCAAYDSWVKRGRKGEFFEVRDDLDLPLYTNAPAEARRYDREVGRFRDRKRRLKRMARSPQRPLWQTNRNIRRRHGTQRQGSRSSVTNMT